MRKTNEIRMAEKILKGISGINHRQLALLSHALRKPNVDFTINSHRSSHRIAYATARSDLLNLVKIELLKQRTIGNAMHFSTGDALYELMSNAEKS